MAGSPNLSGPGSNTDVWMREYCAVRQYSTVQRERDKERISDFSKPPGSKSAKCDTNCCSIALATALSILQ